MPTTIDELYDLLNHLSAAELVELDRLLTPPPPDGGLDWVNWALPQLNLVPPSPRHQELWMWAQALKSGERPQPFVAVWPRGSGKSTTAELVATYAGATNRRRYAWYVSGTQSLADLHVDAIASFIESDYFSLAYPVMAERKVGKFGNPKGWRRNRLRCANGFTVDALGLDISVRGMKIEEQRPDLIILDDIDDMYASYEVTEKRIRTITSSVLPAGAKDVAILCIQNLVANDGFFGRMVNGNADYLHDRIMSGPYPALYDLQAEQIDGRYMLRGGEPSWDGQDLKVCQQQIDAWGYSAFLREAQHEIHNDRGMFSRIAFKRVHVDALPEMVRTIVVVDPAVTSNDSSDSHGIAVASLSDEDNVYMRHSVEEILTPYDSIRRAILLAKEYGSREVYVEVNQGADMWEYLFNNVVVDLRRELLLDDAPSYFAIKASVATGGKVERAQTLLGDYERGTVYHVLGTHEKLESALRRFPNEKPFDLVDATVYSHGILREGWTQILM